jgi:7-cyano-7-deazaguanine synthase
MRKTAVLTSGGMDSSILLWDLSQRAEVYPIYVQKGLSWETTELSFLSQFIGSISNGKVHPVTVLNVGAVDLYGEHWSLNGVGVPGADTSDESVFLPGRNILLIGLAAIWCYTNSIQEIAIGSLSANPFPDATPKFFVDYSKLLSEALNYPISISAPYRGQQKDMLIKKFSHLPLNLTFTCIFPISGLHCGSCNKCSERKRAFQDSGSKDLTAYYLSN